MKITLRPNLSLRTRLIVCTGAVAALIGANWRAAADDPPPANAAEAPGKSNTDAGWRPLFDGKTLKNWTATDFGGQGSVVIKEGKLVVEAGQPLTGVTWTGGELPNCNYELRLEAQKIEGSDFFLALTFPYKDSFCSLVLGGWGGGVIGLSTINGFDASENETTDYLSFENGKWYKIRLKVTDEVIDAWFEDERIVTVETKEKRFSTRIEVDQNRPLGLCTFQTTAAYRNIELRPLAAAKQPPAASQR